MIFTNGNSKMGKNVKCFNLPPLETCTPTKWCAKNCYALKGRHTFANVKASHQRNLEMSKLAGFSIAATIELDRWRGRYVRIHAAGDFYDEEYVNKWFLICRAVPHKLFKATTRRLDLREPLEKLAALPNVVVRASTDPSNCVGIGAFPVFAVPGTPVPDGHIMCNDDCEACKYECWHNHAPVLAAKLYTGRSDSARHKS